MVHLDPDMNQASSHMPRSRPPSKRRRAGSKTHIPVKRSKSSNHNDSTATDNEDKGPQTELDPNQGMSTLPAYYGSSEMQKEPRSVEATPPPMSEALLPSHVSSKNRSTRSRATPPPHKRPGSSMAVSSMLNTAPRMAQAQTDTQSFPPKQQQQYLQASNADDVQALLDGQSMNLDFCTAEAGDVLEHFDFDSFLASKDELGLDFDRSERKAEDDEETAVATTEKKTQGEGAQDPSNTANVTGKDDHRSSDDGEKGISEREWLTESAFDTDEDEDAGLVMAPSRSYGETRGAPRGRDIVTLPSTLLGSRTDRLVPNKGSQPGLWPRRKPLSPSPSQVTVRPSRPSHDFLTDEDAELSDEPWQPSEYASRLPHEDEDVPDSSTTRTPAGMFIPYDKTEEEIAMNQGLFGSLKKVAYTARDMAHVIWNGGQKTADDKGASPTSPKKASESTQVEGQGSREEQEGVADGAREEASNQYLLSPTHRVLHPLTFARIDNPLKHSSLDELERAAKDFAKKIDTSPALFIKAAMVAKAPPNWKNDERLTEAEAQSLTSDEEPEQGVVTLSIQVRTPTLPLEPIETGRRTLPLLQPNLLAHGAAGSVSPQRKQEEEEQQSDDAAEAVSETDDVVGRAEIPDVGREQEQKEEQEEPEEAADATPIFGEGVSAEEADEAALSAPREHTPDEDDEMINYSDEELQAKLDARKSVKHRPKSLTSMQFTGFAQDEEPVKELDHSNSIPEELDLDLSDDYPQDTPERTRTDGKYRNREKQDKTGRRWRAPGPKPDMPVARNLPKTEDTGMKVDQILNSEKEPRRARLPRISSIQHTQGTQSMNKESVTESLIGIVDFLERYTLLEVQDLERARSIVADA